MLFLRLTYQSVKVLIFLNIWYPEGQNNGFSLYLLFQHHLLLAVTLESPSCIHLLLPSEYCLQRSTAALICHLKLCSEN